MICEHCHQPIRHQYKRGVLVAKTNPTRIYYKGLGLPIKAYEAAALAYLIEHGRATTAALSMVATGDDVIDPIKQTAVVVHRLRKRLPHGVEIKSVWREGYQLVVE